MAVAAAVTDLTGVVELWVEVDEARTSGVAVLSAALIVVSISSADRNYHIQLLRFLPCCYIYPVMESEAAHFFISDG